MTTPSAVLDQSTIMVQNMMEGLTVIAADAKRNYEIIFQGRDDPNGEDIQEIPEGLLNTPQFLRALRQGIFEVKEGADHPAVVKALARQSDAFKRRMQADTLAAREVLDAPSDNDLLVVVCIGPGSREENSCGEQVPIRSKDMAANPPLCSRHAHLADFAVKRGKNPWTLEMD